MRYIEVAAAIIIKDGQILAAQKGYGPFEGMWEFPGGKLEAGETAAQALHRELIEEMDVHVDAEDMEPFYVVEHQYPDFELRMHCFICKVSDCEVNLKEHADMCWATIDEIEKLEWLPADRPVVDALVKRGF